MVRRVAARILQCFVLMLDYVIPKKRNRILVGRQPTGNAGAFFEWLQQSGAQWDSYFWLTIDSPDLGDFLVKHEGRILRGLSMRNLWIYLRARVLVSTHGRLDFHPLLLPSFRTHKMVIQLFHGVPLKAMGWAESSLSPREARQECASFRHYDVVVMPSKTAMQGMITCYNNNPRSYLLSGQPRNDHLVRGVSRREIREMLPDHAVGKRLVLYAPTWRRYAPTQWFPFDDFDRDRLIGFLVEANASILLRGHEMESANVHALCDGRNLIDFGAHTCREVNDVLPQIDVVVSDYSSIYIDYLLLDRPCIFLPYDFEEYCAKRSLLVDDYDFWTPGDKPATMAEFIHSLKTALDHPAQESEQRQRINRLYNYHQSDNSCERIAEWIESHLR